MTVSFISQYIQRIPPFDFVCAFQHGIDGFVMCRAF